MQTRPGAVLALALVLAACRAPPQPPAEPSSAAPASVSPAEPTAPAAPAPAPVSKATALEPAGPAPLSRDGETVVDPAASFEVEVAGRFADARVVLLDAADAHVAATSARELGAATKLTLAPAAPLVPGSRYVLRLDGAASRELHDDGGRAHAPISFALLVAGTPPPPEPKKSARRRRR